MSDPFDIIAATPSAAAKAPADPFDTILSSEQPAYVPKTQSLTPKSYEGTEADVYSGIGEYALHYAGGAIGSVLGGLHGIASGVSNLAQGQSAQDAWSNAANDVKSTQDWWNYEPKTESGKDIANAVSNVGQAMTPKKGEWGYGLTGEFLGEQGNKYIGPGAGAILSAVPTGVGLALSAAPFFGKTPPALDPAAMPTDASQYAPGGSAATKLSAQLANASPEMANQVRQEIAAAQLQHGPEWQSHVDFAALNRNLEADSLPVPGRLSADQASGDPTRISDFMNNRGKDPRVPQFLQWQNKNLADNLSATREEVGPAVMTTDMPSHGDTLIKAYKKTVDEPKVQAISDAYQALEDANGGNFPVDAGQLLENTQAALSKKLLSKQDPGGQVSELTDLARRGGMTMENYLAMRQNLGDVARTSAVPAERTAASKMINELEKLPLPEGAPQQVKALADTARSLAKQRFDDIQADPAYEAAVNGTVAPDDFVRRFLINGKRDDIATMAQNLSVDPAARQTMGVAVIDHLRESARLNPNFEGNFAADSYAKQVQRFQPAAQHIFQNGEGQTLQTLANYAKNSAAQPKGAFVNNSNTAVVDGREAALSKVGDMAGAAAATLANRVIPGAGTVGREWFKGNAAETAAKEAQQQMEENFRRQMGSGAIK